MRPLNICLTLLLCFSQSIFSQNSDGFIHHVSLIHSCGISDGSISIELSGDPGNYSYQWDDGSSTLNLENLTPGDYIINITDIFGCYESHKFTILALSDCQFVPTVTNGDCFCIAELNVQVIDPVTGAFIGENELNFNWTDGDPSGLTRTVSRTYDATYCVNIAVGEAGCCEDQICFDITKACESTPIHTKLIVNETNRKNNGQCQFLELLAVGNCKCEKTVDIRKYIIDDNNGFLIQGNNLVNEYNKEEIGISSGYIQFTHSTLWAEVPIGSLIVIYDDRTDRNGCTPMPPDDPTDANNDMVYIIPVSNSTYLSAHEGEWNQANASQEYGGNSIDPNWEQIKVDDNADGFQVRNPEGIYRHGISFGTSIFALENNFSLWISELNSNNSNCRFMQTDYSLKSHYDCDLASSNLQTPGAANSETNSTFIEGLRDCAKELLPREMRPMKNVGIENEVKVYPNPFSDYLNVQVVTPSSGEITFFIHDLTGKAISSFQQSCKNGSNNYQLDLKDQLSAGVFSLQTLLPDGSRISTPIIFLSTN